MREAVRALEVQAGGVRPTKSEEERVAGSGSVSPREQWRCLSWEGAQVCGPKDLAPCGGRMVGTRLKKPVEDSGAQPEGLPSTPGPPVIAGPGSCWFMPSKPHQFSVQVKELWANSHAGAKDREWQHPPHTSWDGGGQQQRGVGLAASLPRALAGLPRLGVPPEWQSPRGGKP